MILHQRLQEFPRTSQVLLHKSNQIKLRILYEVVKIMYCARLRTHTRVCVVSLSPYNFNRLKFILWIKGTPVLNILGADVG